MTPGWLEAAATLAELQEEVAVVAQRGQPPAELMSLWHSLRLARLTVASARARRESRGLHYNPDCPQHGDALPRPSRIRLGELD